MENEKKELYEQIEKLRGELEAAKEKIDLLQIKESEWEKLTPHLLTPPPRLGQSKL